MGISTQDLYKKTKLHIHPTVHETTGSLSSTTSTEENIGLSIDGMPSDGLVNTIKNADVSNTFNNRLKAKLQDYPTPRILCPSFLDAMVYRCGDYRHQTTPVKLILAVMAFEAQYGSYCEITRNYDALWAVTAHFTIDVEERLRNAQSSPITYLRKRFSNYFGETIPVVGLFEGAGNEDNGSLHVHMLMSKEQFPDGDALKKELLQIFGDRGDHGQIEVKQTIPYVSYEQKGPLGVYIAGAAGFLLYAAKNTDATRLRLGLKRRCYKDCKRVDLSNRPTNKRLQVCLDEYQPKTKYGNPLNQNSFYFDDLIFQPQDLGRKAKELWYELQPEFREKYENGEITPNRVYDS